MRRAAVLQLRGAKGPRQRVWERMRALAQAGRDFALRDLVHGGEGTAAAREYVQGLARAGYLELSDAGGGGRPKRWRLVRDVGAEAPRVRRDGRPVTQGLAQEAMWRTMRLLGGEFSARELAAHAATPEVPVSAAAASTWLHYLARAGYVRVARACQMTPRGKLPARYALVLDTGPRPPMVCRTRALFDPNLGKVVWRGEDVTEEDAIYGD